MREVEIQNVLKGMVLRIIEKFNPERIILFGSCAKGDTTPDSDIDILVVMPVEGSRRNKANEIDLALADRTLPMDVIVVTPEQFERQKGLIGTIVSEAAKGGKVIYERAA